MASTRHLTDRDIEKIQAIIDAWSIEKKFGWRELREAIQRKFQFSGLHRVWSRVQLAKYPSIKSAYDAQKAKQSVNMKSQHIEENFPPELRGAIQELEMKDNKICRLETIINSLYEQFEKWLYNARAKGLTEDELNMPIPIRQKGKTGNRGGSTKPEPI